MCGVTPTKKESDIMARPYTSQQVRILRRLRAVIGGRLDESRFESQYRVERAFMDYRNFYDSIQSAIEAVMDYEALEAQENLPSAKDKDLICELI